MGAYGSPELPPNNSNYTYGYYQKPKNERYGCLKNGLIAVCLLLVFFVAFGLVSSMINSGFLKQNTAQAMASSPVYPHPEYVPPVLVSSAPVYVDDSTDFLQAWTKAAVLKALIYPDTAKFSDNLSDWKIVRDGNICEISSIVMARGKESKEVLPAPFVVRITYNELAAEIIYVSIGGRVSYDKSKVK